MEIKKKSGLSRLTMKTASIIGASLAALAGFTNSSTPQDAPEGSADNSIELKQSKGVKPMPVLKINWNSPDESKFVTQHSSHGSHSSHSSHSSHYSHSSGGIA